MRVDVYNQLVFGGAALLLPRGSNRLKLSMDFRRRKKSLMYGVC